MKNYKILSSLLLVILVSGVASAGWFGITGNAVKGVGEASTGGEKCNDFDGGTYVGIPSAAASSKTWFKNVQYDACTGPSKTVSVMQNGVLVEMQGSAKIKEYYCDGNNRKSATYDEKALGGPGVCVYEDIIPGDISDVQGEMIPHKKLKVAYWLPAADINIDPYCREVRTGTFQTETETYVTQCSGKQFIKYSCDGDSIQEEKIDCENKCNVAQGGCYGTCSGDSDPENDRNIPGAITIDDEIKFDECSKNKASITQYECVDGKSKSSTVSCGSGRICDEGTGNGAFCRARRSDEIETDNGSKRDDIESLRILIIDLQDSIAALEARIAALE